ncbi:hypothetical protein ACFVS2_26755 [Brevibacillus sp. NPDC058079]|uniref:hypothetical protein n=1 Tax=Brevibacillus sp. NPDC058079 TaxID=3346330 RepID=UPI0036E23075
MSQELAEIIKGGFRFSIDHYTVYDNQSTVEITWEFIPIGQFSSLVEIVPSVIIRDEFEFACFVEQWLDYRSS